MSNAEFKAWMAEVDAILMAKVGLSSMDMRDRCWRDAAEDGTSPEDAINDLMGDPDDMESFMMNELFG